MPKFDLDAFQDGEDEALDRLEGIFLTHLSKLEYEEPRLTEAQRRTIAAHRTAIDVQRDGL